jgi:hypothetical protein
LLCALNNSSAGWHAADEGAGTGIQARVMSADTDVDAPEIIIEMVTQKIAILMSLTKVLLNRRISNKK